MLFGLKLIEKQLVNKSFRVFTVPCLSDNYAWILQDISTGAIGIVDTPSAKPIIAFINQMDTVGQITVLNTHHHRDHTGGNTAVKESLNASIVGPSKEKIPAIDRALVEGDFVDIGATRGRVIDIPGHTCGHIGYVFDGAVFVGDTLFGHGCGALFEGSPAQMWKSLDKIANLPQDTLVFCAHEYTLSNVMFGLSVFPDCVELGDVHKEIKRLRDMGQQTVPSLLQQELRTNPFLQARHKNVQERFNKANAVDTFTYIRTNKDGWKP